MPFLEVNKQALRAGCVGQMFGITLTPLLLWRGPQTRAPDGERHSAGPAGAALLAPTPPHPTPPRPSISCRSVAHSLCLSVFGSLAGFISLCLAPQLIHHTHTSPALGTHRGLPGSGYSVRLPFLCSAACAYSASLGLLFEVSVGQLSECLL